MQTGSTVSLSFHVWRGQLAYYVLIKPPSGRRYLAARGVVDRPSDPIDDTWGRGLMDAAYEAYRALGE